MKNILLILVFTVFALSADAQQPGIPNDTAFSYCDMIVMERSGVNTVVDCTVNFGGVTEFESKYPQWQLSKFVKYKSVSEPLNILGRDGWELVLYYKADVVTHYILKKRR